MNYGDEEVIEMMNGYKNYQTGDIYSGIYIREEFVEFEEQLLFDDRMSIYLPKKFEDMSLEQAKVKYPMEQRPQVIKTTDMGDTNFTFSLLEVPMEDKNVKEAVNMGWRLIKQFYPASVLMEQEIEQMNEKTIGWYAYISPGIDQKIYNFVYDLSIDGKYMHGVFNSLITEIEIWRPIITQVLESIKDVTIKEEV